MKALSRLTERPSHNAHISPKMRTELIEYFSSDVALLEKVVQRDLVKWVGK